MINSKNKGSDTIPVQMIDLSFLFHMCAKHMNMLADIPAFNAGKIGMWNDDKAKLERIRKRYFTTRHQQSYPSLGIKLAIDKGCKQ